ncbi:MAG TPA: chromosome segregation protein SMC, partial [bacterium]|nr:chromosome segregation protein SMC [bacterium]
KRLELVGFKSFVDPTVIDFDAPVIGIVGPNGCGKSNVVDAIRWVMGEMSAKSLRGKSMEDVIFNGSDKKPPLGMAEVSLTFSTEDGIAPADYAGFSEITVTRRLYRSGESDYLINKVPGRLRDVIELFLGTGVGHKAYSIIEQGKIDFVINAKPEERRLLLEEAAGISKFKARKEAALRKMEATGLNLARLKDILHEVSRQINSLDRQVKKAERYKVLKNELREIEIRLSALGHAELNREISELRGLLDDWTVRETASTGELSILETDLERGRIELAEKDQEFNRLQERGFEVTSRLRLLEAESGFKNKEIESLDALKDQAHREIVELKGRQETLAREKEEQQTKQTNLELNFGGSAGTLEAAENDWKAAEGAREELSHAINRLKEERHQAASEIHRLEAERRLYEERQVSLKGQFAKFEVELTEEDRLRGEQNAELQEKSRLLQEITRLCASLRGEIETVRVELADKQARRDVLSQELKVRQEELVNKRSRLKSLLDLERNFEGYEEGVRAILQKKKDNREIGGVFGVVADFIETSPRYETAVSAALGEKLQYVIVQGHEEGVEAINYLKAQSTGRSSFIPIEVRDHASEAFPYHQGGVIGPLMNHVKIREDYRKIGQFLLGDVVLVETLGDALTLWRGNGHKKTLVTLDGEVVDPSGVVSGGTSESGGGIRGKLLLEKKREIKELRALCAEMEEEIGLKEDTLSQLEGSLSELGMNQETLVRRAHEEEMKHMSLGQEVQHLEEEYRRVDEAHAKIAREREEIAADLEKADASLEAGDMRRGELIKSLEEKDGSLVRLETEFNEQQHRVRLAHERLTSLRVEAAALSERRSMAERESERLLRIESDLRQQIEQKMSFITEAHRKIAGIRSALQTSADEIRSLKTAADELTVSQEDARRAFETLASGLKDKEARVRDLRKENDLAKSHTGDLRVTLSRAETEISHLEQRILEKYSVNLAEVPADVAPDFNQEEEEARLNELKSKLEGMGDVNLGAIPEYEELKVRQDFLSKQIQDLEDSIEALKKAIHRINQTTKLRFEATFEMVNERFKTLFPRLFSGGRAEMRLQEGEDGQGLLNAGVELLVQPPGKKLSHIGLLSGGEKALSAVAFVFSIFLVKPSPFCILDEVDAPLDDLNTQRFHNLLQEMTPRTQFILITHNRRTMEKADLLYGVTMQEPGCSQLVSVRMNEAMKLAS